MRIVIYGAGAIGGVLGARLIESGHDVALIARGAHYEAIKDKGLEVRSPDGTSTVRPFVVSSPRELAVTEDDVVLLAMKSQDTSAALGELCSVAQADLRVACVQNGTENERSALRHFRAVYGVCVVSPCAHVEPGVVAAYSAPTTGILDVGRYPAGVDDTAESLASAFGASTFSSVARPDVMGWKYTKLLTNLGNAIEAVCGPPARQGGIGRIVESEGVAALEAAGIEFVPLEDDLERRRGLISLAPVEGDRREGGSSWQSLTRRTGAVETDYLNGEIVLLGRLHGVPTPANALLQRLANSLARERRPPGAVPESEFMSLLEQEVSSRRSNE